MKQSVQKKENEAKLNLPGKRNSVMRSIFYPDRVKIIIFSIYSALFLFVYFVGSICVMWLPQGFTGWVISYGLRGFCSFSVGKMLMWNYWLIFYVPTRESFLLDLIIILVRISVVYGLLSLALFPFKLLQERIGHRYFINSVICALSLFAFLIIAFEMITAPHPLALSANDPPNLEQTDFTIVSDRYGSCQVDYRNYTLLGWKKIREDCDTIDAYCWVMQDETTYEDEIHLHVIRCLCTNHASKDTILAYVKQYDLLNSTKHYSFEIRDPNNLCAENSVILVQ